MKSDVTEKVTITIPSRLKSALQYESDKQHRSLSNLISRLLIDLWLDKQEGR